MKAISWLEAAAFILVPVATLAATPFTSELGDPSIDAATERLLYVIVAAVTQVLVAILGLEKLGVLTLSGWLGRTFFGSLSSTGSALATVVAPCRWAWCSSSSTPGSGARSAC